MSEKADELDINFVGNVEGRDAFTGDLDILVCDGFTGNVFLKTVEGFGKLVKKYSYYICTLNYSHKVYYN